MGYHCSFGGTRNSSGILQNRQIFPGVYPYFLLSRLRITDKLYKTIDSFFIWYFRRSPITFLLQRIKNVIGKSKIIMHLRNNQVLQANIFLDVHNPAIYRIYNNKVIYTCIPNLESNFHFHMKRINKDNHGTKLQNSEITNNRLRGIR